MLRRHETPFEVRVDKEVERERLFQEKLSQKAMAAALVHSS